MKIITWNLNNIRSRQSWPYAINKLSAEISFLQEAHHPLSYINREEYLNLKSRVIWEPTENGWGNSIITKSLPITQTPLFHSFKGRILSGTIQLDEIGAITLVNLHTPITAGRSRHNLKKMFSEIAPFIGGGKAVIAGDLNFGECFDKFGKSEHLHIMQNLLDKHNLIDCHQIFHETLEQTFRPPRRAESLICIDYIFISKDMKGRLKSCEVLFNEEIKVLSDHNPVSIILDLR